MAYYLYLGPSTDPVLFPVTPEKLSLKISNQNKTVTLIDEGEVNLIKTPGLTDITIDSLLLPMAAYPFALYEDQEWKSADFYLGKLEKWKNRKRLPIYFTLSRTTPSGDPLWDTVMRVTVESYEIVEDAKDLGMDVEVKNLKLKEWRANGAKKLEGIVISLSAAKQKSNKGKLVTYTVAKGDTLKSIAKAMLYSSSRWKDIYELNKSKIEKAAKAHGRKSSNNGLHIYKGTKLTLPKLK
ncbi:MAG: LysM peptidoglycan-binding domain-containing protein [Butyricicoccus sp.]